MKFKIGDKVRNKINGKIGVIVDVYQGKDIDENYGCYKFNYAVQYETNKYSRVFHSIMEIEKIPNILDKFEKDYLSNVIKPFKDRIKFICKRDAFTQSNCELIVIEVLVPDDIIRNREFSTNTIILPMFKKNTMYKGMETYKKYTLKELYLD